MFLRRARDDRGAAAVEFALVMLPLIYLLFGVIQYGLYFYASSAGANAVGDAVRRISVGDCQSPAELRTLLKRLLGSASPTTAANLVFVDATGSVVSGPIFKAADGSAASSPGVAGGSVTLSVRFDPINMHFPFIPLPNAGHVTRTAYGRVEDVTATAGGCS